MKIKSFIMVLTVSGACSAVSAQSLYPGQHKAKVVAGMHQPTPVECFDLSEVRLLPGRVRQNLERDSAWMVNIFVDRLIHSFRTNAGVYAGREGGYESVRKYGGWESLDCELRGHTAGHLMSAYSLMYAATGDNIFKLKGDSIVTALAEVQDVLGNGYLSAFPEELINRNLRGKSVWAPWYTLHKLFSGLIDQYLYAGNGQALDIVKKMGDWAYNKLKPQSEETRRLMLRNEFGGMNEAFCNLYSITGDERYKWLADYFYHNDVLDPLKNGNYDFGTKHTNTFIPKLIGEARNYELSGNVTSRSIAEGFWNEVTAHHSFATGSCSQKEHFFPVERFSDFINGYTGESCCTYNMLKLTRHLFCWNPSAKMADYYERALFNHILGQQDPETGMVCYFLPLKSGAYKLYSTKEQSFRCCVGSGFESHAKYAESIYFKGKNEVMVNLFIPSVLTSNELGVTLRQNTGFPYSDKTVLTVDRAPEKSMKISLRYPYWSGTPTVRVNGKKVPVKTGPSSYITLNRRWKAGDRIEMTCPMKLHMESAPDNPQRAVVLYGPVVLAGQMGTEGVKSFFSDPTVRNDYYTYDYRVPASLCDTLHADPNDITATVRSAGGKLRFKTSEGYVLLPFFDTHHTRHVVYWNIAPAK